jgi:polyisoprenyl-teichoic acid--peptidoglycan teichoic acid transferase
MNKIFEFLKNIKFEIPKNIKLPKLTKISVRQFIFWGVTLVVAVILFIAVKGFTDCWQLTALPGVQPSSCGGDAVGPLGTPVINAQGTPLAAVPPTPEVAAPVVQYPTWDGGSRINIVFFGLRGTNQNISEGDCPHCTDTIMVLTLDPVTKTAGMLSIPRDMWVHIPGGYGDPEGNRINQAWTIGEGTKYPQGGGPGLAMKTVSQFIGVPIQYYIQVDFSTFVSFINLIGGVDVYYDVPSTLNLDPLGNGKDHFKVTCCGIRHMDGQRALAFARCRDVSQGCSDGDVGRAKRQQEVIIAIRNKVFTPENFAKLMAQAPTLYNIFSSGIHTNMNLADALKLAPLAKDISLPNIKQGVIDNTMIIPANVTLGGQAASVDKPIPDKIRVLSQEIFTSNGPTGPIAKGDAVSLMKADAARVRVINDTYTANLDGRTGNYLLAQGMHVTESGAPTGASDLTYLVVYSPKLYALRYLISLFGIKSNNQILFKPDPASTVDIEIRIGNDWASKLPAGY